MTRSSGTVLSVLVLLAVPTSALSGDLSVPSPLTFDASRNGDRAYNLNWTVRLGDDIPVRTRVKVGLSGSDDGRLGELPLRVTTGIRNPDDSEVFRRSLELTAGQAADHGDAAVTWRRSRPLSVGQDFELELRQSVTTGLNAGPDRTMGVLRGSQTLIVDDIAPKTSLQATTTLASDQRGPTAQLRIERQLLSDFRISADFNHNATKNSARIDARYFLSW
ncbi:hypothetical protein [Rhizobium sp. RU36D]|uniref:hypothetical protein n=1 Tax=Rhizobium sp. RU36D TaxID=1907415 RepID=UPI0009D82B2B|nr:hypothetical protein [Rhizobium sp. RU36D]SMC66885.1 hypothetical protein SAMN05880593_104114 [Rhizobium sp. RU36D]